jgi:gluconokinase
MSPPASTGPPTIVVAMGVAGCGKSTVGLLLAGRLGVPFVEGDDFHPAANKAKMAAKHPLDDADRAPWLAALALRIRELSDSGTDAVVSCSALKRGYRDLLAGAAPGLWFLYLALDRETAYARIAGRTGHFMPAALLDSQYETLEPPTADEPVMTVDAGQDAETYLDRVVAAVAERRV